MFDSEWYHPYRVQVPYEHINDGEPAVTPETFK